MYTLLTSSISYYLKGSTVSVILHLGLNLKSTETEVPGKNIGTLFNGDS